MKIIVLITLSIIFFNFSYSQQEEDNVITRSIANFTNEPSLQNAAVSFHAIDLNTNKTLASYNENMSLPPASIMKLYTTALSFEALGAYYKPETKLYISGEIDSLGVLNGDIWIKGGGDPTLGSAYFNREGDERLIFLYWADAVLSAGIKKVNGRVIADGSDFGYKGAPEGWSWGDLGNYYGAGPSGCVIFDNMTYLDYQTSAELSDSTIIACIDPYVHNMKVRNEVKTSSSQKDNAYIYGAPYSYDRIAVGSLPYNKESFKVKASIPDPELQLAQEFQFELGQYIEIEKPPIGVRNLFYNKEISIDYSKKQLIYTEEGKMINTIAYWTNLRSINLFAEQLLCLIGYEKYGSGSSESGIAYSQNYWDRIVGNGLNISDGSGLSRKNSSSASNFTSMLKHMSKSNNFDSFKKTLPIAGLTGTLSRVCRGQAAHGKMYAKSGTMNRIKAYSGYIDSSSGKKIAFALIVNNHTCSNAVLLRKMETVFNSMANY